MFYKNDMDFCLKTFAPDYILWSQDYPYGVNDGEVRTFLEEMALDEETRANIAHRNAEKLFGL